MRSPNSRCYDSENPSGSPECMTYIFSPIANGVFGSTEAALPIANSVSGSAGATLPIANGHPGSTGMPVPTRFRQAFPEKISGFISSMLIALWFLFAVQNAVALDSDSKQPIYIEANTATYEEKTGQTVYTGDVKATQGSLDVRGDQMTVYQKGGQTEKIVVTGNPTRLKQTPEGGKEDIHGTSQRADYFPDTGILILYDKALVWQGQNSTASDIIEYDTKNGLFKAGSPTTGSKRVHVKMQPKEKSE